MSNNKLNMGKISAISISEKKGIPKSNVDCAELIENFGIKGDAHAGKWHRQVSLLAMESIDTIRKKGLPDIKPGDFAENITTEFINIPNIPIGTHIRMGKTAVLEITQIGKECHSKCKIHEITGDCVMPREGIFARVITGGIISTGDEIEILGNSKFIQE
jgi:MOSC domain-containing protein YiiM